MAADGQRRSPVWAEVIQLLPVISLALPFIIAGQVDLSRAGWGFLLGAGLSVPVTAIVVVKRFNLNLITLGTAIWLWLGAVAFQLEVQALRGFLIETQAFGLFVCVFLLGVMSTFSLRTGFVGAHQLEPSWARRASLILLLLSGVLVIWAWLFRADIRLGGGLPFILLNVVRRVMMARGPKVTPAP